MKRVYLIMALFAILMVSCVPEAEKATVETREITDVTSSSARVICNVSADGGAEVSSRGICWGSSSNPTIETVSSIGAGSGIGNYECEISGLESNTTYFVRAYATNEKGTSYGDEKSFTTLEEEEEETSGYINGYEYIDLGLPSGLKWATHNIGATTPEGYGNYYAWGETSPKAEYTWENSITYGEQMSDISGNAQYDAATANWGGGWRMPTRQEMEELVDHCEWEWTQVNGVYGSRVTGPNGSCIFLPAAGYRNGSSLNNAGYYGYYWSSTPYDNYTDYSAFYLHFNSDGEYYVYSTHRGLGHTVRSVSE